MGLPSTSMVKIFGVSPIDPSLYSPVFGSYARMELTQTSSGLICVFHRSLPVAASTAAMAQENSVYSLGLSAVGCRGAVFTSVPKNSVLVSGSYDGVDQTLLVAGPKSNLCFPHVSSMTTGGSSFSGFGPTSYFQMILPDFGSSATRKPLPVLPG